jgi:formiminoglutamase
VILSPIESKLFFSKNDPRDVRLGDLAKPLSVPGASSELAQALKAKANPSPSVPLVTLTGYPDDEGILKNGGRIGAAEGPDRIRNYLYKMTPPAFIQDAVNLLDLGNLAPDRNGDLTSRHQAARDIATASLQAGARALTFGGGHDYGFPDAAAYCSWSLSQTQIGASQPKPIAPLVINFDAHLDVRPLDHGLTSGTPFFRLLEEFPEIDFVELGIQSQCNSKDHVQWLREKGGRIIFEEERVAKNCSLSSALLDLLGDGALRRRSAFISVDIDGFSSAYAPGASQSWPTGFSPDDFFRCLSWCFSRFDVRGLGIYEVAPRLDIDDRTSRLAALIAHRFMFQL